MRASRRQALGSDVHAEIRDYLVRQSPEPGTRLRDTDLAAQLGVSRTPIREALLRLEREGLVDHRVGRGFRIRPLSMEEAEATYPIVWTLEGLALRSSPQITPAIAETLTTTARAIRKADNPTRRIDLDNQWHAVLVGGCGNPRLLQIIADLKHVVRRYELRYMDQHHLVERSKSDHFSIVAAARRDTTEAARLLEHHWTDALAALRRVIPVTTP